MTTATENKLDLFVLHKAEYIAKPTPSLVQTKAAVYLSIAGTGRPDGELFAESIGALYGIAYTIKMRRKFSGQQDYVIAKLEGIWPQTSEGPMPADRTEWQWKLMIRTPEFVMPAELKEAAALQLQRGKSPRVHSVELLTINEEVCIQALHKGPYDLETETISKMHLFAQNKGMTLTGAQHDIYLSDPRRVAPEKLRTIIRRPAKKL